MLMKPGSTRPLTEGERELAMDTFGTEVDLDRVRVMASRAVSLTTKRAFCAGGMLWPGRSLLVFPSTEAKLDFSADGVRRYEQSVFVHEMTHVWQSQKGINLLLAKLKAGDKPSSYEYDLSRPCQWDAFNIEQQAMIVQDNFLRCRGWKAPHPPEAYLAVLPFRREGFGPRTVEA